MKGGVLFITSRILVVDLLRRQCPVDKVAGLLVFNAHRYHSTSSMYVVILDIQKLLPFVQSSKLFNCMQSIVFFSLQGVRNTCILLGSKNVVL